jgi:uncharacterized protein (DUF3084 family)
MDAFEYLKMAAALGAGGLLAKLLDKFLRWRRDDVETEDAINNMAIRQLQAQMEQMSQQVARYESLVARYEKLEIKFNTLQDEHNNLKSEHNKVVLENTELKLRITQLEEAHGNHDKSERTNSRSKGVAPL